MLMSISFSDFFKDFLIILGAVFQREGGEVGNKGKTKNESSEPALQRCLTSFRYYYCIIFS